MIFCLILSKFIDLAAWGLPSLLRFMFIEELMAIGSGAAGVALVGVWRTSAATHRVTLSRRGGLDVCDGAHWAFVMKKDWMLAHPPQWKPTHRKVRDEWGTRQIRRVLD